MVQPINVAIVVPMLRFGSTEIDDLLPMRIQYWDNSFLFVKNGYTKGVKCLTENDIEWLSTHSEDEKTIIENALADENSSVWNIIMVPIPANYINLELYFAGHFESDILLESMASIGPLTSKWNEELCDIFEQLTCMKTSKMGDVKMVVVDPKQKVDTPMEEGPGEQLPPQAPTASSQIVSVMKVTQHGDKYTAKKSGLLDILNLDTRGEKDLLQADDVHKYEGDEKFNPKSFKSGPSVGYIDVEEVSYELKLAQVRILQELMFDVIPLSRYNHLVRNGGSKVWVKWTALTAVPLKAKM